MINTIKKINRSTALIIIITTTTTATTTTTTTNWHWITILLPSKVLTWMKHMKCFKCEDKILIKNLRESKKNFCQKID